MAVELQIISHFHLFLLVEGVVGTAAVQASYPTASESDSDSGVAHAGVIEKADAYAWKSCG